VSINVIRSIAELDTPVLLVDESIVERNIERMQALADRYQVSLRPHIKTHKMSGLAKRQLAAGACGIAVAKLGEAEMMAAAGTGDIQIANELVGELKLARLRKLCETVKVSCAVDSPVHVRALAEVGQNLTEEIPLFIEIDTGLHRCGLTNDNEILNLARVITDKKWVRLHGILTHAGHVYAAGSKDQVEQIGSAEGERMVRIADMLRRHGFPCPVVSVGSTPTVRYSAAVAGVTEIRPGHYIFNDMMQVALGSATVDDCALTVLVTVISCSTNGRVVIDAGSKALALDRGAHGNALLPGYGYCHEQNCWVERLSEEHGVITGEVETVSIGRRLRIIPNHACAVVNGFDEAWLVAGDRVKQRMRIDARGHMA